MALSTLIVYALMRAGWVFNREAGAIATFYGWLRGVLDFPPSALGFLRYVLVEVYTPSVVYTPPPAIYNPMLWTMSVELAGSALVFLFWYLSPSLARPRTVLAASAAVLSVLGSFYALFLLGMLLSQWRADGRLQRWRADRRWQFLAPCLALAAATGHAVLEEQSRGYRHASLAAAAVLVGCCYTSRPLLALFRSRLSRWLGNVSFPLYLTHFAVIVSFTSWCVVATAPLTPTKAWAVAAASLAVALLVAAGFRPVERIALRAVDARLLRLLHRPSADAPKITLKSA